MAAIDPNEPVMLVRVRDLLADTNKKVTEGFADLNRKLDDRVTLGAFGALRADVDTLSRRVKVLEDADDARTARSQGVQAVLGWVLRFGGWLVATGLAIAWLWVGIAHG